MKALFGSNEGEPMDFPQLNKEQSIKRKEREVMPIKRNQG